MADAETAPAARKSDLGPRTASALVMGAVAGTALWLGGYVWIGFVALIALGVLWEWNRLVHGMAAHPVTRGLWNAGGILYVGLAAATLAGLRMEEGGLRFVLTVLGAVIATDIGAYFAGRTFGGPKIAPKVSPSKTWSGLCGGMLGAALVMLVQLHFSTRAASPGLFLSMAITPVLFGALIAIVAQSGDFFESWMKRRAGVKDSSGLIPGHGGLFDRVDGLLAVCFVLGIFYVASIVYLGQGLAV